MTVPGTTERLTLVQQHHGVWPAQRTVRINVPDKQRSVIAFVCTSAIADQDIAFGPAHSQFIDTSSTT